VPRPFRWRAFWQDAPKEWTQDAETLLGERVPGAIGAALWSKINPTTGHIPTDPMDPRSIVHQLKTAVHDARRSISRQFHRQRTVKDRLEYLQTLPAHLRGYYLEESEWHEQEHPPIQWGH
jgi:hypothetical protein